MVTQTASISALDVPRLLLGEAVTVAEAAELVLRRLGLDDFDLLLGFRQSIVTAIANPDIIRLMPEEENYVRGSLETEHLAVGLFQGDKLVAYNSLFFPVTDDHLRALHIYDQVKPRAPAHAVAFAGGLMVAPACRGMGLQKLLIEIRQISTHHLARPHHFSTVSLANHHSWLNILAMGGRTVALYEFTDPRHGATSRMLTHQSPSAPAVADERVWVDPMDIPTQRRLLAEGLVGTTGRLSEGRASIAYQREIA